MRDVALVLSSGGARGLAHIGAIEELEAQGYRIRSIVGCSMGAIIGGMYAAGKLAEYKEWMQTIDKKKILSLLDITFSLDHLVKGEKIIEAMKEIVPDVKIEDLPIPFKAVATDWEKGQEVVFSKGSLYEAIRASISMPLFFDPVKKGGTTFVDGGILNPLPLNISKDMPGDIVVAVNVSGTGEENDNVNKNKSKTITKTKTKTQTALDFLSSLLPDEPDVNYFTMSQRLFRLMVQKNAALNIELYKPDILVNIPMDLFGPFEYDHVDKISTYGRKKMREALKEGER
jgi:NTE family protein